MLASVLLKSLSGTSESWTVILGGCNSFIHWKHVSTTLVLLVWMWWLRQKDVLKLVGQSTHRQPDSFSWYLCFNLFEAIGGKIRAENRQRLLHSRILLDRTRSPELQTWRSRQWRGKHQGEPSLCCWCASNCQIPKKQLSIKSATKVVLNNMEKKLQTTSWLSETMVKPPNCPKNNSVSWIYFNTNWFDDC